MGIFTRKILRLAWIAGCSLLVCLYVFAGAKTNFSIPLKDFTSLKNKPVAESEKHSARLLPAINLVLPAPPPLPKVEFELPEYQVTEYPANPNIVWVSVKLDIPSANTVTVPYTITGGTPLVDYTILSEDSSVIFAPGETRKLIEVRIEDNDPEPEATEEIKFKLENPTNATLGRKDIKIKIYDDYDGSKPKVNFLVSHYSQAENNGTDILVKVVLYYQDDEETEEETVKYRISGNAGEDQGPLNTTSVTLNGNNPVSGSGVWTLLSGQGNYQITDPGRYNTTVTGLIPGTYEFSWTITGADCGSSTDAVTIIIDDAADKPVAVNDAASTDENMPVTFSIVGNDTGAIDPATVDLDPVSPGVQVLYSIQGQGSYTVDRNGILTFTPVAGFTGAAKPVSYTVRNMLGELSNQAVISITVNPTISLNPFAMDDYAETVMDEPVIIAVVDNDIHDTGTLDPTSVKIINLPEHGTVVVKPDGTVVYTPETGFIGADSFNYTINDTNGRTSNTAEVVIFVNEFRSVGPIAFDDFAETKKGNAVTIAIAENDIHDLGTLNLGSIKIITLPEHGSVVRDEVENDGSVIYIPDADYTGNDSFTYTISDFEGNVSNIATVDVVVTEDEETSTPVEEYPADGNNKDITIDPLVSPNGDGYGNEFFLIRNIQAFENEVSIFNRWGNEVFRIKGYNEADRVFTGYANMGVLVNKAEPLTNGVYYYIIYTYKTINGEQVKYMNKGYLILKR